VPENESDEPFNADKRFAYELLPLRPEISAPLKA